MQAYYPASFVREMGCTEAQWTHWLPQAIGKNSWTLHASTAEVRIEDGVLRLTWQEHAARVIGLVRIPVLQVCFLFVGLDDRQRRDFMTRFDLYMQRGGG